MADITYVRLDEAFVYLAVVIDAFSRKVAGWALDDHLKASLALAALQMALDQRQVIAGGLIHHSDRGVQYACGDYVDRLRARGIQPSMSRVGCPYDNAMAESFMKTLKTEEVDGQAYRDLAHARAQIGGFIEEVYNRQRLHSALDYLTPEEYEAAHPALAARGSPCRRGHHQPDLSLFIVSHVRGASPDLGRSATRDLPHRVAVCGQASRSAVVGAEVVGAGREADKTRAERIASSLREVPLHAVVSPGCRDVLGNCWRRCMLDQKMLAKSLLGKRLPFRIRFKARLNSLSRPFDADTSMFSANREAVRMASFALIWLQSVDWRS